MRRMFRECRETRDVERRWSERLEAASKFTQSEEFKLSEGMSPEERAKYERMAREHLGIPQDAEVDWYVAGKIAKEILEIKRDQKLGKGNILFGIGKKSDEEIKEILEARKPEMPKLREVEKSLSNEGVLKAETQPQQSQQSYSDKYQAAMQAAQQLASSGYYTLEDAVRIVMANL